MKQSILAAILVAIVFTAGVLAGQATQRASDAPYIPTRLEWMVVSLNAQLGPGATGDNGYGIMFEAGDRGNLVLHCRHTKAVDSARMKVSQAVARRIALCELESRGWAIELTEETSLL